MGEGVGDCEPVAVTVLEGVSDRVREEDGEGDEVTECESEVLSLKVDEGDEDSETDMETLWEGD